MEARAGIAVPEHGAGLDGGGERVGVGRDVVVGAGEHVPEGGERAAGIPRGGTRRGSTSARRRRGGQVVERPERVREVAREADVEGERALARYRSARRPPGRAAVEAAAEARWRVAEEHGGEGDRGRGGGGGPAPAAARLPRPQVPGVRRRRTARCAGADGASWPEDAAARAREWRAARAVAPSPSPSLASRRMPVCAKGFLSVRRPFCGGPWAMFALSPRLPSFL